MFRDWVLVRLTRMTSNDLVLLDTALLDRQSTRTVRLPDDVAFEMFAFDQILRDYELVEDELALGRIGGSNDGGIDGVFVFVGDNLLDEDAAIFAPDFQAGSWPRGSRITVWFVRHAPRRL